MNRNISDILSNIENKKHTGLFFTPAIYSNTSEAKSYYFTNYSEIIIAESASEIPTALNKLQEGIEAGLIGFGYVSYETGYYFEESLQNYLQDNPSDPYLYFILCEEKDVEIIPSRKIDFNQVKNLLKNLNNSLIDSFTLNTYKEEYIESIKRIKKYIQAGDTYQVNFTIKGKFNLTSEPKEFFISSIFNQSSEYSAFINTGEKTIISTSPEMFFEIEGNSITTKPMKGTISKGRNLEEEKKNIELLKNDSKNKAENIMIVDLLRNDIGKICELTSVKLKEKHEIKSYESLHQMISTVIGKLKTKNLDEIFHNIFPCGSITGAPKIRTMQIIRELEKESRGIYTGAIGIISKDKTVFNVPIRTAVLDNKTKRGEIGIGSGVVWDSVPEDEFEETKLKAEYMSKVPGYFELIESILIEDGNPYLLEYHIQRLRETASFFLFNFSETNFREKLNISLKKVDVSKKYKCRVLLDKWGSLDISFGEIEDHHGNGDIKISRHRIDSCNKFQYFKTTNRSLYNSELKKAVSEGFRDVIFLNEKGEVAEGAITNIISCKNGNKYTPPLITGVLNGCYRQYLIDNNQLTEKKITMQDLLNSDELSLINSVRKVIKIKNVFDHTLKKIASFKLSDY